MRELAAKWKYFFKTMYRIDDRIDDRIEVLKARAAIRLACNTIQSNAIKANEKVK